MSEAGSSFAPSTRARGSAKAVIQFTSSTTGENAFLSDTYTKVQIPFGTIETPSSRHIFESMKFVDTDETIALTLLTIKQTPKDATTFATENRLSMDPNWNNGIGIAIPSFADGKLLTRRDLAMIMSTYYKFLNQQLAEKLLSTGQDKLELISSKEKDPYASVDSRTRGGENMLGNSLMLVRRIIREEIRREHRQESTIINKRRAKVR